MKKLSAHITFYYIENRIQNLKKVVNSILNYYQFDKKDIFIHTNTEFETINNTFQVVHDCSKLIHPWHLTWLHRKILKSQINDYDIFMYVEDDILINSESIDYWLEYEPILTPNNLELGFLRIETNNNQEYVVDLLAGEKHYNRVFLNNNNYVHLLRNYKGFWIYNKQDIIKFCNKDDFDVIPNYIEHSREISARGMQNEYTTTTVIPMKNNKLDDRCKVYHLSNNYVNDHNSPHAKVRYENCI